MTIPIFIIVHDRVEVLKKSVKSFEEQINTPIEIIFHDVASTFPGCIEYLEEMKGKGYKVYRSPVNDHLSVLVSIKTYLTEHPECEYYVMTDPDIELDNVNGDILEYYVWLMKKYENKNVIGPMLRIDDIPDFYPKKNDAIRGHTLQFWRFAPSKTVWNGNDTYIQNALIDTTFHLAHRNNINRSYPKKGIRCRAPYSARHLDWYIDPNNLSPDQEYYSRKASHVAHWGKNIV